MCKVLIPCARMCPSFLRCVSTSNKHFPCILFLFVFYTMSQLFGIVDVPFCLCQVKKNLLAFAFCCCLYFTVTLKNLGEYLSVLCLTDSSVLVDQVKACCFMESMVEQCVRCRVADVHCCVSFFHRFSIIHLYIYLSFPVIFIFYTLLQSLQQEEVYNTREVFIPSEGICMGRVRSHLFKPSPLLHTEVFS